MAAARVRSAPTMGVWVVPGEVAPSRVPRMTVACRPGALTVGRSAWCSKAGSRWRWASGRATHSWAPCRRGRGGGGTPRSGRSPGRRSSAPARGGARSAGCRGCRGAAPRPRAASSRSGGPCGGAGAPAYPARPRCRPDRSGPRTPRRRPSGVPGWGAGGARRCCRRGRSRAGRGVRGRGRPGCRCGRRGRRGWGRRRQTWWAPLAARGAAGTMGVPAETARVTGVRSAMSSRRARWASSRSPIRSIRRVMRTAFSGPFS